jgi:hypothetical protein
MSDETPKKRPLSEIGHLFLSSMRERHMGETPRPKRTPPGQRPPEPIAEAKPKPAQPPISIDLTPEEYAQVFAAGQAANHHGAELPASVPPVTAVLAAHLGDECSPFERVKQYARDLASRVGRVGLIELDASAFRLMCFDASGIPSDESASEAAAAYPQCYDARQIAETIEEMNCDVQQWLLLVAEPRTPEAKALLRKAEHWVLLSTCDHDGVVASYRLLKGLADGARPRLSIAVVDAPEESDAARVRQKLRGVCEQFLDWSPADETIDGEPPEMAEHLVMFCRPTRDKAQIATAPQWSLVEALLDRAAQRGVERVVPARTSTMSENSHHVADLVVPSGKSPAAPAAESEPAPIATGPTAIHQSPLTTEPAIPAMTTTPAAMPVASESAEVIDLSGPVGSAESILGAVLRQIGGGLIECPLRAPMWVEARLAVARDRRLVILAVARQGLTELRGIGQAYHWLNENRALIGMAMPQFAIDTTAAPSLRLFVDQADVSAEIMRPLLQNNHVTVQAYRTLRWGGKTGLLLEAA